jgi:hypothetical protein
MINFNNSILLFYYLFFFFFLFIKDNKISIYSKIIKKLNFFHFFFFIFFKNLINIFKNRFRIKKIIMNIF